MAVGILILRLALGLVLAAHGAQKLFGWFGGHGLRRTGQFFASLGFRPGTFHALVAGVAEAVGGLLVAAGLLTPLGTAASVGVMVAAIVFVHLRNGFFAQSGGVEYPLLITLAAVAISYMGAGAYSLDRLIGWTLSGAAWGSAAIGLGLLTAGAVALNRWVVAHRDRRGAIVGIRRRNARRLAA